MNLGNIKTINKLEKRFLKELAKDYPVRAEELYVNLERVEIDYLDGTGLFTTLTVCYGRYLGAGDEANWQKKIELVLKSDNLEYIAGQFSQAIYDKELLEEVGE